MSFPNDYRTPYVQGPTSPAPSGPVYVQSGPQTYSTGQFVPPQYAPPTGGFQLPPPKKKRRTGLIVTWSIFGVVFLVVFIGVVAAIAASTTKRPMAATQTTAAPAAVPYCEHGHLADGSCAGADQPENAPSPSSTFKLAVGETVTETSDAGVARITVTKMAKSKSGCRRSQMKSQNGTFLIVDVKVEIVSGTASVNPLYWEFVDSDGSTESEIGGIFAGCKALGSGNDIPAGLRTGQVVFDVASPVGEVTYNEPGQGPVASWVAS